MTECVRGMFGMTSAPMIATKAYRTAMYTKLPRQSPYITIFTRPEPTLPKMTENALPPAKEERQNTMASRGWEGVDGCEKTGHNRDMCSACETSYTQYGVKDDPVGAECCEAHGKREDHECRDQDGFVRNLWTAFRYVRMGRRKIAPVRLESH